VCSDTEGCVGESKAPSHLTVIRTPSGYGVVRVIVGLALLVASASKAYQIATEPLAAPGLLGSRWLLVPLVEFELALGSLLLVGLYPQLCRRVVIPCFATFAVASVYEALNGVASCGCFGKASISPWLTFVMDIVALAALWRWRPSESALIVQSTANRTNSQRNWWEIGTCLGILALGLPIGWAMVAFTPGQIVANGSFLGNDSVVVLDPEKWIGKTFPLQVHIDLGDQLLQGRWTVVLFHHDCPKCKELIASYESLPTNIFDEGEIRRVALVEFPPFGSMVAGGPFPMNLHLVRGRITNDREWFVATPVEIELEQGVVRHVSTAMSHSATADPGIR